MSLFTRRRSSVAAAHNLAPYSGYAPLTTYGRTPVEPIPDNFAGYAASCFRGNGVVSAVELVRISVFSEARFQFQELRSGQPGRLYGTRDLEVLERPWPGGTTGDLLSRMLLDADLAGNAYVARIGGELVRLRPDWVDIVLALRTAPLGERGAEVPVGYKRVGYAYYEGGRSPGKDPAIFLPDQCAHFAPLPDPLATFRGMSWLTPVIREIQADDQATRHKSKFWEHAAPQPIDARVLTPAGWATMGELQVGGHVIGSDGKPHQILGVFPQGEQDIYRVTFVDGSATECTLDHVWRVQSYYDRKIGTHRVMSLGDLIVQGLRYPSGAAKWSVPLADPVEYDDLGDLPLHPYLLGALLGDGSFRGNGKGSGGVSFSTAQEDADEMQHILQPLLPAGVGISRRDRIGWSEFYFRGAGGAKANPLTQSVRGLGLFDVIGRDKWIPEQYLRASISDRVALLQGLLDTDGHVGRTQGTSVRFTNTSETLSRQLADLIGSLGGSATTTRIQRAGNHPQWVVNVKRLPEWITPFRLARKVERYHPATRVERVRHIEHVNLVGRKPAQCILVDSEDHLYVTDDYVLTHNTPNLAVSIKEALTPGQFDEFVEMMEKRHTGAENAYRTMYMTNGADVTVVGANMQQVDFASVIGRGETRVANAAGVHPVVVGLSEGMQGSSLNAGNYQAAKRSTVDRTFRPLWRNVAGSLEAIVPAPQTFGPSRLWIDTRDVAFLRDDTRDLAEIQAKEAQTIRTLLDAGFEAESVKAAVIAGDWAALRHSGLYSVQLIPPDPALEASPAAEWRVPVWGSPEREPIVLNRAPVPGRRGESPVE